MKIILAGYGKMGKLIAEMAMQMGHEIKGIIEKETPSEHYEEILRKGDVLIDFTGPDAAFEIINAGINCGIPVVSGSTGWLNKFENITTLVEKKKGGFIYASNFSLGVNLFFALNEYMASIMKPHQTYIPTIQEIHHLEKLDAPSGTAITLSQVFENQPPIESLREKEVPGTHVVQFSSSEDIIQIKHEAKNRNGFAKGAIAAAEWIIGKQGVFSMKDVLKI